MPQQTTSPRTNRLKEAEQKLRKYMITLVLTKHRGDRGKTAEELGITRIFLNFNCRKFRIDPDAIRDEAAEKDRRKGVARAMAPSSGKAAAAGA